MNLRALLLQRSTDGCWRLFVVLPGDASNWPEYVWPGAAPVPTPAQRLDALARLGYRPQSGTDWEWCEAEPKAFPARRTTMAALIGSAEVCAFGGGPS